MRLTSGGVLLQFDSLLVVGTLEVSTSAEVLLSFVPANNAVTSSWGANLIKPNSSAGYLLNPGCYGAEEGSSPCLSSTSPMLGVDLDGSRRI